MTYIEVSHLQKSFGTVKVLNDISFTLEQSQVMAIVGPSGSGKSTILRCLNGLEGIDFGTIHLLDGEFEINSSRKVSELLRQKIGMVFQGFHLWPHLTVLRNITEAPIRVLKVPKAEATAQARDLLARVGLSDKESCYPATLSGGEQQRVAIARALAMNPEVLLLDEITSALDPELVYEVLEVIKRIVKDHQKTIVMVTHEMGFAREIADKVIFLDHGRVVESGTPEEVIGHPQNERIKIFLSRILAGKI